MASRPESRASSSMAMEVDAEPSQSARATPQNLSATPQHPRSSSVPLHVPQYTVGYVYSAEMTSHFSPHGHPEQPDRITRIWKTLLTARCTLKMKWIPIRPVLKEEALLVHSADHWDKVQAIQFMTDQERVDSEYYYEQLSLYVMSGTTRSALLSCGGVIEASLAVARNELKKSFAIVRPPGHHAEPEEHMGFCFFNNVAVAARVVQQLTPIKRIMILDWDVHHGNGTQRAFNDDPSVLYVSLHRYEQGEFYPCGPFGGLTSCGEGAGLGFSVNIPWPEKGMGDADYLYAFQKIVMPIAMEFSPELVIISAGFDAAAGDDLGECFVSPAGYAHMTHMLSGLAGGRLVVALEGGYNLDSISDSALAVTQILLGEPPEALPPMVASEAGTETVYFVAKQQSKYWKCMDPKACEPVEEPEKATFSIPEILKAHRQYYLYKNYEMLQIPLMNEQLEEAYPCQIMCSADLWTKKTLVFFVHEFGNLRMELESSATCDVHMERSYLIDFSKELIRWVRKEGYSLVDANLFPKKVADSSKKTKAFDGIGSDLPSYIWDNYIQLSGAERIILIGHGPGCEHITNLINSRTMTVMRDVEAVIQVAGHSVMPPPPKYTEDLRQWYKKHSLVVIPTTHPLINQDRNAKEMKKHGRILPVEESRPVILITRALPSIEDFVRQELAQQPLLDTTSRTNNITTNGAS